MADEMPDMPPEQPIGVYTCPHCSGDVAIDPGEHGPFIDCPHCGGQFTIASNEPADLEYESREEDRMAREAELDGMRIRQLSLARRALIRARTYLIVGIIGCLTAAEELARRYVRGWDRRSMACAAFTLAALLCAGFLMPRFAAIGRELRRPLLEEPTKPPDFTGLSDGSQRWKDLEDVQ